MLVLTRKLGEAVVIHGLVTVRVLSVRARHVRLGITAPREVQVYREEITRSNTAARTAVQP